MTTSKKQPSNDSERLHPTPEREAELLAGFQSGTDEGRTALLHAYAGLVGSVARRYHQFFSWTDYHELMEEGNFGLLQAAEHFEPTKKTRFSTYAWFWIVKAIQEHLGKLISILKVPPAVTARFSKITHFIEMEMKASREPSLNQIASHLELELDDIKEALGSKYQVGNMLSLNEFVDGDEQKVRLSDMLAADEPLSQDLMEQVESTQKLDEFLNALMPQEAAVIRWRFGLEDQQYHTLKETAQKLNLTPQKVRDIEITGLARLKALIEQKGSSDFKA